MQNTSPLAWLIGNEGSTGEFRFKLTESETTLGRGSDCEIQLDDQHASRRHAIIHFRDGGFEIEDLNSSNGTFVNNKQISAGPIADGDLIQIGDIILQMRMEGDPDATIIQPRLPLEGLATSRETVPHEHGAVSCIECGQSNPKGGNFCFKCSAVLPQLPVSFQKTIASYKEIQTSHKAGELSTEDYHAALAKLVVQDDKGEYWMMGVESGEWYWYNGEDWDLRSAPLILPKEEKDPQPATPAAQEPGQQEGSPPPATHRGRWGVIGLWLIGALFVLGFGIYAVIELLSFSRGQTISQLSPLLPAAAEDSPDSIDSAAGQSDLTTATATPSSPASGIETGYQIRPYNPSTDASLLRLTTNTEYMPDQSSTGFSIYEGYFPTDTSGLLVMGWCAIDQETLNGNMEVIQMEGTLDGTAIPQDIWTRENAQQYEMFCHYFRAVVEDLKPGTHQFLWSTSYNVPVFDGWDTLPPGNYQREYTIDIEEQYLFFDDFNSNAGHWGETEREELKVWIEGGDLHIELYQSSIGVMSNFREREFDDFMLITRARNLSGTAGSYGIVFRRQDDQTYYFFEIKDEGFFRLGKRIGEFTDIIPWTPSEAILKDGGVNRLAVSMEGDWIMALINGELVVDLHDTSIKDGKLSLVATAPQGVDYFHAAFQQVSIEAPE